MKRLQMSTGAWIFAGLVAAAIVAPTAGYAVASSTVAIGNPSNALTANISANRQLLTTTVLPSNVIVVSGFANAGTCQQLYMPPAGKAIVVTQVTYDLLNNGAEAYAFLSDAPCTRGAVDWADTNQSFEAQTRTFPVGLPLPSVGLQSGGGGNTFMTLTGYLIPATQLPAVSTTHKVPNRVLHRTP